MRQLFRRLFLSFAFLLFCPTFVSALDVPKQPEGYVSDYANLLSDSTRSRLEQSLKDFEEKTGNQVLVATFPGLQGDSLESYSIRLAEAWKPGQKGKDNGVILLIFKEDRKVRIEVGYGLEGVLTDALCKLVIENEIAPRFRAGDYDGGIERAVAAILSATRGEYRPPGQSKRHKGDFLPILVFLLFISQFLLFLFRSAKVPSSGFSSRGYYRGYGGGGFSGGGFGGFGGGGGFSGGGGGFGGGGSSGSW